MAIQRKLMAILLAGALCLHGLGMSLAAADDGAASGTVLWDTASVADGGSVDFAARKNWQLLARMRSLRMGGVWPKHWHSGTRFILRWPNAASA